MKRSVLLLATGVLALGHPVLLAACSDHESTPSTTPAETPEELARHLNAAVDEQDKRPEHTAPEVTIQHLLIAVRGSGVPGANKSPGEGEALAAELFARARNGEDFDTLVKNYTNDTHPGVFVLSLAPSATPDAHLRTEMVPALGNVAWRLEVGEIGVCAYDGGIPGQEPESPFGYHLVKRLK